MTGDDEGSAASPASAPAPDASPAGPRRSRARKPRRDADAELFAATVPDSAAPPAPDAVERAFELARGGHYTTVESIAGQLKSEGFEGVDLRLFDADVRKTLRQACAEGRMSLLRQARIG